MSIWDGIKAAFWELVTPAREEDPRPAIDRRPGSCPVGLDTAE